MAADPPAPQLSSARWGVCAAHPQRHESKQHNGGSSHALCVCPARSAVLSGLQLITRLSRALYVPVFAVLVTPASCLETAVSVRQRLFPPQSDNLFFL